MRIDSHRVGEQQTAEGRVGQEPDPGGIQLPGGPRGGPLEYVPLDEVLNRKESLD